jgi:MFS family permease
MNPDKLWSKDFVISTFINFFITINFFCLLVIMTVYAIETFNSVPSEAGLSSSIFIIGAIFSRILAGKLIERVGRGRMLYIGLILGLVMTLLYFTISNIITLLIIRFIHGAAFGIASTTIGTIVSSIIPENKRGQGIGYYMLSATLATALGPFIAIMINQYSGYHMIFVVCAIFSALSVLSGLFLTIPEIKLTTEQMEETKGFNLSSFFEIRALPISIIIAVQYFAYSSVLSFLTAYTVEINLVQASSFFFVVIAIVIFISRPFTGRIFDLKGENYVLYPSFIIFSLGMVVLSQADHAFVLLLAAAIIGLGAGAIQSNSQAVAIKVTPRHRLGLANSTYFTFMDIGAGFGPFFLGFIIPWTGYRGLYLAMAFVGLICLIIYHVLHGKNAAKQNVEMTIKENEPSL